MNGFIKMLFTAGPMAIFLLSGTAAAQTDSILVAGAHLTLLFDGGFFLEGPAVSQDGRIFFSDITFTSESGMQAGYIWQYDPGKGKATVYRSPSGMANGIIFDRQGRMLVAEGADYGGRAITRTDIETGKSTILAGLYQGKPLNSPNDLVLDCAGRLYFTDPRYTGHEPVEQPLEGIYRLDTDGTLKRLAGGFGKPNGIVISPDQHTLYVSSFDDVSLEAYQAGKSRDPGVQGIIAFDLAADGSLSNRRILVNLAPEGGADGLTIDTEGRIYAAVPGPQPGIFVYSPEGKQLCVIQMRVPPSNVTFGRGAAVRFLYITAGTNLYEFEVMTTGFHPDPDCPDK